MTENQRLSPENIRLLNRLTTPKTYYGKWRIAFLKAGKMTIFDNTGTYYSREDVPPFGEVAPNIRSTGVRIARPEAGEVLTRIVNIADISLLNIAHLLQEGGIIITSQNPQLGTILQFGLSNEARRIFSTQESSFKKLSVGETVSKGVKPPGIQDYDAKSQVTIIDPNILDHVKKVGIWLPGIRRQSKFFDQNGKPLNIAGLKEAFSHYIDYSFTNINPSPPNTVWRKLRNEQAEIVTHDRVAADIIESFFRNISQIIK